jgi:diketogulonate reductase-like aldo/keto reductase
LILGAFSFLECTLLFPLKWILGKIDFCMFPTVKALFFFWLYYPKYRGALLIEKLCEKYIDMAYEKAEPIIGKYLNKLGVGKPGLVAPSISSPSKFRCKPGKNDVIPRTYTLNNGDVIPLIGLGSSRISNIVEVVSNSIKDGLRLIDTAFYYKNEEEVGKGIKVALDAGYCKREDLFVIGKLWIEHKNDPEKAIKDTLSKLGLTYLDMYLDHWPSGNNYTQEGVVKRVSVFDLWPKMEDLVDKGLTKSIGCSNYNVQSLFNLLSFCRIKPVANEVEYHPYYSQLELKKFCDLENIALIAYYPLAKGNGAKNYVKEHNGEMDIFKEKVIVDLVEKYKKTPGQIILNWEVVQNIVTIPGTSNKERMKENLGALDFKMDEEDIKRLNQFGKKMKFCGCRRFFGMNILA